MILKMKELLGCIGDQSKPQNQERTKKRIPKTEVSDTKITPDTSELLDDFDKQMTRIHQSLNNLYADDFGEDLELFSLMLDIRLKGEESSEDAGYCALV